MAGPASDDRRVRMSKRKGYMSWMNSAGCVAISVQHNGPTFHVTSQRDPHLAFIFEYPHNTLLPYRPPECFLRQSSSLLL